MNTLIFDIETDGLLDKLTKLHCGVIKNLETGETKRYRDALEFVATLQTADLIVGHNILCFDMPALEKITGLTITATPFDTLVATSLIWSDLFLDDLLKKAIPPKLFGKQGLEAWGRRLKLHKGDFGKTTDWAEWSQDMEDYCAQDVEVTAALYKAIVAKNYSVRALELEHAFRKIMFLQERHGFGFNTAEAAKLYAELSAKREDMRLKLQNIFPANIEVMKTPEYYYATVKATGRIIATEKTKKEVCERMKSEGLKGSDCEITPGPMRKKTIPFNPASTDQVSQWLIRKYKWKPKEWSDGGKPQVTADILEKLKYPEAKGLKEFFALNKICGQISEGKGAWLKCEQNGRIHGRVITCGAVTGRCTHKSPNVAQVPRVGNPWGRECRSLFIPSPGYVLVGWDAEGLELRCLAHFMSRWDAGAYGKAVDEGDKDKGTDIHTLNQKAAGLETRDQAKTFIYAFLYGAGDAKIGSIVGKSLKAGKALRASFMAKLPALNNLVKAVKAKAKRQGYLTGLDGRRLKIRSEHAALNTLLQSAGALLMKRAALEQFNILTNAGLVHGKDWALVANIHDEIQAEALPDCANGVGVAGQTGLKLAGEFFNFRCPLAAEYKIGKNWAETH